MSAYESRSRKSRVGMVLSACAALTLLAGTAEAQVGPAVRIQGAPVAAQAIRARFAFSMSGNRIVWVNEADEVYYHRVNGNRVDMQIRMRGQTVGMRGDPTKYVIPESNTRILVVTQRGDVYRHEIRSESISAPAQIPGAPVGTGNQDPFFMFMIGNQLVNVTRQGEIWAHNISRTVEPPRRIGRYQISTPRVVRHVFNLGRTVYVISDQGEIYAHDIHPEVGQGRLVNTRTLELGHQDTRFVFVMGNRLFAVNTRGETWAHDISRLMPQMPPGGMPPGQAPPGGAAPGQAPPAGGAAPAPAPAQ